MSWRVKTHDRPRWIRVANAEALERWRTPLATVLAQSRTSAVQRVAASESPTGEAVVVKEYRYPTARDRRRGVLRNTWGAPSRAARESTNLRRLAALRVNPDLFVECGEQRHWGVLHHAYVVTRAWPGRSLDLATLAPVERARALVELAARLHAAGYVDRDFHARNVLIDDQGRTAKIDCPRGSFPPRWLHSWCARRDLRDLLDGVPSSQHRIRWAARYGRLAASRPIEQARAARRAVLACRTRTSPVPR